VSEEKVSTFRKKGNRLVKKVVCCVCVRVILVCLVYFLCDPDLIHSSLYALSLFTKVRTLAIFIFSQLTKMHSFDNTRKYNFFLTLPYFLVSLLFPNHEKVGDFTHVMNKIRIYKFGFCCFSLFSRLDP
jgi:hypothetical protein